MGLHTMDTPIFPNNINIKMGSSFRDNKKTGYFNKKGKLLNSFEKYYIFLISKKQIQMNKFNIDYNNAVFQTVY
jgi:hypothetical protein